MDTNRLKKFATEARTKLKAGIGAKIITLGFDKNGNVREENKPQLMQGGSLWNGQLQTEGFYYQWMSLYNRVQQKGVNEVYEEAAYTWFNRLMAIRILQKNDLCAPVLDFVDESRTPFIVDEARQGHLPQMKEDVRVRLLDLLDDDTKVTEQFAVLITAWCHDNPIINSCFESMGDYTELLLPNNVLTEDNFVDMINHTEFITDEDFKSPELIGWLYQFYISERKDEVFAKKGKFEADEIPAATQIFTPNWIVKYMVQNTVGRIYLDNNPYETQLQKKWQYLVEPSEKASADSILKYEELTDLKVADLACGSGHILNECFDLLYDLYIAEGYGRGEAVENIFRHNLTGVDLDTRAKQLATFALLLKACQKDNAFADAHCLPCVLDMPEKEDSLNHFFGVFMHDMGEHSSTLLEAVKLCNQSHDLGSIMKFDITEQDRKDLAFCIERWEQELETHELNHNANDVAIAKLILALTEKYHALIANPPYMGRGHMTKELSSYLDKNYPTTKADLFSAFMEMMLERTLGNGKTAFITMESWMFLSSFEKFRKYILDNYFISSMGHFGWHIIGIAFGTAMTVIDKCKSNGRKGEYSYLTIEDVDRTKNVPFVFPKKDNGKYAIVNQQDFEKIPGCPIGYWVSEKGLMSFSNGSTINEVATPRQGMATSDVNRFIKFWHEVSFIKIGLNKKNHEEALESKCKWFPHNKGGGIRRWYGNNYYVVNWENGGEDVLTFAQKLYGSPTRTIKNINYYFLPSVTWGMIGSGNLSVRRSFKGFLFDVGGPSAFEKDIPLDLIIAFLNSKVAFFYIKVLNPTLNYNSGDIGRLPYLIEKINNYQTLIKGVAIQNISISKQDWDAHETSWDFETNPLLAVDEDTYIDNIHHEIERHEKETGERICIDPAAPELDSLEWRMEQYKQKWEHLFMQLHENEEELNRQFIDIYGLQDELTPDVPLDEITILQQGEVSIENNQLKWHADVVMKQLISYAVGCMLGRYRLDKPGLHIAHPSPLEEDIAPYMYKGVQYEIDDDGIMPLMPNDCGFSDNASLRLSEFIRTAFGEETQVENLNFIEQCLGKSVEQYFVKDFWKDHKKMYQNRPIYWLFSSQRGAFQVIAYMHRMDAYTVERIRAKYLLPYIENVQAKINDLEARAASLSTQENRQLQRLNVILEECREYHERLQVVAEQAIGFDLDDGVVVNYAKFGDIVAKIK